MDVVTTAAPNTSLRQRMLQDMQMRGLGEHTHKDYNLLLLALINES